MIPSRAALQSQIISDPPDVVETDVAIIGSGMGGGCLAYALRDKGIRVLIVEQGDFLPVERENWSFDAVHTEGRYKNSASWHDAATGKNFTPGNYHYVGGSTKLYGATLPRFRECDFGPIEHADGLSPAWPIDYADLEPYYGEAEQMFWVHSNKGEDPTDPWRSTDYPYPGLPHEGAMARLAESARKQGLHPFSAPQALDYRPGGGCVLCDTCDSFACMVEAKGDADVSAVRPALAAKTRNVELLTNAEVVRLVTSPDGKTVAAAQIRHHDRRIEVRAHRFVLSCGAVNTAALLLRSASDQHRRGLANSSDQVGRNYMAHITTFFLAVDPRRKNEAVYQKTIGINDWYEAGPGNIYPLGNVQGLGKLRGPQAKMGKPWVPMPILDEVTKYTLDLFIQTEDLPLPENRVTLRPNGQISLFRRETNLAAHHELIRRMKKVVRKAGFPVVLTRSLGVEATSHQCGTARMGDDPTASVVDANLKAHDLDNLWIADTSTFCSSGAVNPAITAAALSLRLGHSGALTN
ncbi:GMC family oxidoreductase [Mycolicibacterium smegmatis]|uniref:FAD-dependent oxidoreductase n=1 Tax=Mycolicibacterium smegmatis TaxID=1772 RepID=UPI0005D86B7D|nr:GMC family oxidoreductase [Mycolicibacterium smegmatis]MDF1903226.1 GMC family oxidoreductase [Mycolicibacterium smegmatis]MDF1909829.1 GMC family oxidoreductase [Mycolicibacterium smegmatis]MDF1921741.1 GMC family oxidoreductase [Mycolicibacterium smegmatis]MDF1928137.1 GMC family oxidoreductase [Mycolicibacterium smegmatis]UGT75338.1 GMC family oxidoreductase [Mycolicibacterium smegmatis]